MSRSRQLLDLPDGRTLCFAEWGDPDGYAVIGLHGTPGSRLYRHPDEQQYVLAQAGDLLRPAGVRRLHASPGTVRRGLRGGSRGVGRPLGDRPVRRHRWVRRGPAMRWRWLPGPVSDYEVHAVDLAVLARDDMSAVLREFGADLDRGGYWGWVDDDLAFTRPSGFDVSEIDVRVEIRYGERDTLVPAAHGRWLAAHVPGARVAVEADGHMGDPDQVLAETRWLVSGSNPSD